MNKNYRVEIANKTLEIIKNGFYEYKGKKISVEKELKESIENTFTIAPKDWDAILKTPIENKFETEIVTKNCSTIEAITEEKKGKICVLNFASAKNPGGGFLGGASAQEESLARSSSLYETQIKEKAMYNFNKNQSSFLYSDYMIYSPNVLFWNDDSGNYFEKPLDADVITATAPNKGAMMQHNRKEEITAIEKSLKERMDKVLAIALKQKSNTIILGAWGCGVFRNEPKDVAQLFKEIIAEKYAGAFKKIVFAVFDNSEKKSNFKYFEDAFRE
ncbi:TIGR02452 family protein [Flavobacterium sp. MC2016-06]|uniref:TIGR02452 family protein n=1 Tax=Flavobacterium sp. MC2016-06 TaxID=2676308 RepID=UPI0012BABD92|nr:TIGR02452 family protein [Flavobacterium sp. MC2016-06]MBU3860054.1 TIGR02452 family protein [Flavobacterium sp. MC2016-06]